MKIMAIIVLCAACVSMLGCKAKSKPLKVYILSGQSNMVGMASTNTFAHIKMFPETATEFKDMFNEDGSPVVLDDVWISSTVATDKEGGEALGKLGPEFGARGKGDKIGPEYTFGIYMHKALQEPILIIKTAWGGKSLCFDFRSPSAGEWTPPAGHPDLVKEVPVSLPLPTRIDLSADYVPGEDLVPKYVGRVGKFMGLKPMRGVAIGEVNGVYPIYLTSSPQQAFPGTPFQKGDLIVGVNGQGLREDAIAHWRDVFYGAKNATWMINVTRWRNGELATFDFDISQTLEGGRDSIGQVMAEQAKNKLENEKNKGHYYRLMMEHVKMVLGDIKRVYPDYDEKQGYEVAGFAWFQGWNDMVNGGTYPNRDKPRGYEQYSWLLAHFIRDVRMELDAPDMPFVIGVMGVGGVDDPATNNKGYFQQGMAAPADYPEFKGNVRAVHTGNYWDTQLEELDVRSHKAGLKQNEFRMKDGLEGNELKKAYAEYRATLFTPKEEEILRKGKSNQGFHYLGSGKTMSGIGKGFAEAMLEMHGSNKK